MKVEIPQGAQKVLEQLNKNGYEAFVVGGCVRDSLMGRIPSDWDITTSALPKEVKNCFSKTIDTGIEHGTVTVRMDGESYEVTTYRIDGKYEDARHPKEVIFTPNLEEDLKRRDFTINAMAYNEEKGLVDLYGGVSDLKNQVIRCVGEPVERFSEDALRMLRALRFSAQLDFSIDENTFCAIQKLAPTLSKISAERIQVELAKLISSEHPERMREVYKSGLSSVFFPEWDAMMECEQNTEHHAYTVGEHTIRVMEEVPSERNLRLAALLHDVAKPVCKKTDDKGVDHFIGHPTLGGEMAKEILRRLKFDNDTINYVSAMAGYHDERPAATPRNIRRLVSLVGADLMPDLLVLKRADTLGQSEFQRDEKLKYLDEVNRLWEQIVKEDDAVSVKDLAINGNDLMALGMEKGPKVGEVLKELLELCLDDPKKNTREYLSEEAKRRMNS